MTTPFVFTPLNGDRYSVVGESGETYTMTAPAGASYPKCECPDYQYRPDTRPCKHGREFLAQRASGPSPKFRAWFQERAAQRAAGLLPPLPPSEPVASLPPIVDDGLTHIRDLLAEPAETVSWVVDGLLNAGGMSIFGGKPKSGKSTLTRAIALRVARGEPVLGRSTTQGPTIYMGLEDQRSITKGHFQTLGASGEESLFVFTGRRPDQAVLWLQERLVEVDPVLIVIDTLQKFLGVSDLNDYSIVSAGLYPVLDLLRDHRAHLMLNHHAGKGDRSGFDSLLGSTALQGIPDMLWLLKRRDDKVRTLATLQRYGTEMEETVLTLDDHAEPKLAGTKAEYDRDQLADKILEYLNAQDTWVDNPTAMEAIEGGKQPKIKAFDYLFRSGRVERQGPGVKGHPYQWRARKYAVPLGPQNGKTESITPSPVTTNAVLAPQNSNEKSVIPQNGILPAPCTHEGMVGGLCPICDKTEFLAALDAEAASARGA